MKKLSYEEFIEGKEYEAAFKIVLDNILFRNGIENIISEHLKENIEIPFNNQMTLMLYIIKEDLNNDTNLYQNFFGLDKIQAGKVMLDNISNIYEKVNKRLTNVYYEYENKFTLVDGGEE